MPARRSRLTALRRARTAAAVATLTVAGVAGIAGPASAGGTAPSGHRYGVVPTLESAAQHALGAGLPIIGGLLSQNLTYGGGTNGVGVTTGAPKVYLVFWGSQWGAQSTDANNDVTLSGDPAGIAPRLQAFFAGLGTDNEGWSRVMTQYCEGIQSGASTCPTSAPHVAYPTGGALAGVWVDESAPAPDQATQAQLGQEAVAAAAHFGNTTAALNRNAQYAILSPTGTHPDGYNTASSTWCAWHDWTGDVGVSSPYGGIAFANDPYIPDMGSSCGANFVNGGSAGAIDGVTIVDGHEYSEVLTDQFPAGGWTDFQGQENADKCAWISSGQGAATNITLATGTFPVQGTWANDFNNGSGGCETSHA